MIDTDQIKSWYESIGKRQVKAPKIYIRDSALLHALLGLGTAREIESHPKVGASWEGFALDVVVQHDHSNPVLQLQPWHFFKFAQVVADQRHAQRQRVCCNPEVVIADGRARPLQRGSHFAAV